MQRTYNWTNYGIFYVEAKKIADANKIPIEDFKLAFDTDNVELLNRLLESAENIEHLPFRTKKESRVAILSPLEYASYKGAINCIKHLIDQHVIDIDSKGFFSQPSVLQQVSAHGCVEAVSYLIGAGADIEAKDANGYTALYSAAQNGHKAIVSLLLKHGAKVTAEIPILKYVIAIGREEVTNAAINGSDGKQEQVSGTTDTSIWGMLKASIYIDNILENGQPEAIYLTPEMEEIVLTRVYNRLTALLKADELKLGELKSTLEGYKINHPIVDNVLAKVDEFVEYNILDIDALVARFYGLSFPQSLKDIIEFSNFQGDNTHDFCRKLLKIYDNHKDEPNAIAHLDRLKAIFESYLSDKKFYIVSHPEHNTSEIPKEMLPLIKELFLDLLKLEGMYEHHEEFDKAPLLEEAILFYSLHPDYQTPGNLMYTAKAEGIFDLI
ncbi:MAG: ankyrin repeat and protein 3-like [Rickettsiaceae bacterium]|jgi:hypothetical protein|nr:ankyrin repeat and protein 3-like [Rickettsiaceae bacterium]